MPPLIQKSEKQWLRFWKRNPLVHKLWFCGHSQKLRNVIRYQGYEYDSIDFYWNAFVTRNIPHYKKTEPPESGSGHVTYRTTLEVGKGSYRETNLNAPTLLHKIEYPYYEIDKELTSDKRRFHDSFRNDPKNVTKFIEPYSRTFYTHVSNPGLTHQFNTFRTTDPSINPSASFPPYPKCINVPFASTFSSSNGMDIHIGYTQSQLTHKTVPYKLRHHQFKPSTNNLINQMVLIELSRKSTEALNELLYLAHERNVNLMVRYSPFQERVTSRTYPLLDTPSGLIFNNGSSFLDLNHSLPLSDEIFHNNSVLTHIKRKKFLMKSLLNHPKTSLCKYCNQISNCAQCPKCVQCDFFYFDCRHITNLGLLRREKDMPLSLMDLAAVACRRIVSREKTKAYPDQNDMKSSLVGQCPVYRENKAAFSPTPQRIIDYIEFFTFEHPQWPELITRFRLETNIEQVESIVRKRNLTSQQRHSMLFETNCPLQCRSQEHLKCRSSYLNIPVSVRVITTQWNTIHHSSNYKENGMFMTGADRREGRDLGLVPNWVYSPFPSPELYTTEQVMNRYDKKWYTKPEQFATNEEWFAYPGRHTPLAKTSTAVQLTQMQNGEWIWIPRPVTTALCDFVDFTDCVNLYGRLPPISPVSNVSSPSIVSDISDNEDDGS